MGSLRIYIFQREVEEYICLRWEAEEYIYFRWEVVEFIFQIGGLSIYIQIESKKSVMLTEKLFFNGS